MSTLDITTILRQLASRREGWTWEQGGQLAVQIVQAIPDAKLDWDADSGEEWARVLVDKFVVAFVRIGGPLVIIVKGEARHLPAALDALVIVVDDMETESLSATDETVAGAFPEGVVSPTLDVSRFSAFDLWYATT